MDLAHGLEKWAKELDAPRVFEYVNGVQVEGSRAMALSGVLSFCTDHARVLSMRRAF